MIFDIITIVVTLTFVGAVLKYILPGRGIKQLTTEELHGRMADKSVQLIDVRKQNMYVHGHIHRFKNIPLKEIRKRATELDKGCKVVVICQTGTSANVASKRFKRLGFKDVENVRGGMASWRPMGSNN